MASEPRALRRIADPVLAAAPAGVRIRTRVQLTDAEASALGAVGSFLGSVYRTELAGRVELGRLDHEAHAAWRARRKQALTGVSSSRWAGAITRAVEDQYQLGMRALSAHLTDLRRGIEVLEQRCALRPGAQELAPAAAGRRRRRGYRTAGERFAKTRRVAVLRARLAAAEDALAAGRPSIVVGGKRLWRNRNHLAQTAMTQQQWQARWNGARMFLTADGESGKTGGNETIRVDQTGRLRIKVPAALVAQLGSHLDIAAPVAFNHRGLEWADRVADRRAVRYDITFDPARNRWYLDASWKQDPLTAPPSIEQLRTGPVLGVDLNADHLACCILDGSGNPIGDPITIPIATAGLPPARRDIAIIGVDPAYTSKWGNQHWVKPLQQQTSEPVTGHHGAATAIGRRGLGLPIRRRPAGPRNGQRTVTGTPPARPDHQPNHDGRHGSSGPPPPTRWVAVHRRTPAASGQHRSGRNRTAHTAAHS